VTCACAAVTLGSASLSHATDIPGVRLSGSTAFGDVATAWTGTIGATYEAFIDGFGVRGGADLGFQGYTRGGRDLRFVMGVEGAVYLGPDAATWRPYFVLEPILSVSPQVFEGLRAGLELEWRDICRSNLRVALGAFYQPIRSAEGIDWLAFGPRLTVAWGKPTLGCVEVPACVPLPGRPCPPS
jgi:hypothetical protein